MVTLGFTLSSKDPREVRVVVFNLLGQPLALPLRPTRLNPGRYTIIWDGRNWRGEPVRAGPYLVEYRAGESHAVGIIAWR